MKKPNIPFMILDSFISGIGMALASKAVDFLFSLVFHCECEEKGEEEAK